MSPDPTADRVGELFDRLERAEPRALFSVLQHVFGTLNSEGDEAMLLAAVASAERALERFKP